MASRCGGHLVRGSARARARARLRRRLRLRVLLEHLDAELSAGVAT